MVCTYVASFKLSGSTKCFTHMHPFTHTHTHMQDASIQCLAQGHFCIRRLGIEPSTLWLVDNLLYYLSHSHPFQFNIFHHDLLPVSDEVWEPPSPTPLLPIETVKSPVKGTPLRMWIWNKSKIFYHILTPDHHTHLCFLNISFHF